MENKEFNALLLDKTPEVRPIYEREVKDFWEGEEPGSTIVVEDYLMPLVYKALDEDDERLLEEFRSWLEEVSSLGDDDCEEVIFVCIFEKAFYEKRLGELKRRAFGPNALKFLSRTCYANKG